MFGGRFANLNLPLLGIIGAVVVLVIILLVLFLMPKGSSGDTENMTVAASTEAESNAESTVSNAPAPTSFTFSYNVNSGVTTWIEVYIDGEKQIAQNIEGPSTKTFTTSGILEFICSDATGVKAVLDGKDYPLTPNEQGVIDIKIDFNDVLAAWQAEHSGVSSSTSSGTGSAAATSSSSQSLRGIDNDARQAADEADREKKESEEASEDEESEDEESEDEEYSDEESADESEDYEE